MELTNFARVRLAQDFGSMFDNTRNKLNRDIPREARLVLCCAHVSLNADSMQYLRDLVAQDVDWSFVRIIAVRHKIAQLLYHNLDRLASAYPDCIPKDFMRGLKEYVDSCTAHNNQNMKELSDILKQFHASDIAVIPFKGVTFALRMHGSLNLRQCGDIDLLVKRKDFLRAKDILIRSGYDHTYFGHHEVATAQAQLTGKTNQSSPVDLHYGITPYCYPVMREAQGGSVLERKDWNRPVTNLTHWLFCLNCDPLWKRAESTKAGEMNVQHFSAEDEMLVAIIQGIKDSWLNLKRVCDLDQIVRSKPNMNWGFIAGQMKDMRFRKKALLGFRLAHDLLETPFPVPVLNDIQSSRIVCVLALDIRHRIFSVSELQDRGFFRLWSHYLSMDSCSDRFRFLIYVYRTLWVTGKWRITLSNLLRFHRTVIVQQTNAALVSLQERRGSPQQSAHES